MADRDLIAPCGLDCFNCPVLEGNITEGTRRAMAGHLGIAPEDYSPCKGCRAERGRERFGQDCATWACVLKKGIDGCGECGEFPCEYLAPTQKGAAFPHNMKVYNLCRMRSIGVEAWIAESAEIRRRYYEGEFAVGRGPT